MSKLVLNTIGSGYGATALLNQNFDAIEAAIENTLSRDGTTPNEMEANLDMNDNNILNVGALDVASLTINGTPVQPSTGVTVASAFQSHSFVATAGQTSFSVSPFTPYVASVQVEVNGLSLPPADISVSGTNVVIPACSAEDEVVIRRYTDAPSPFPVASDISFNQAGTIQTRTVQSKLRDVVSVKDFGAVGDGVTDDTAAIQAFFTHAQAVGGDCIIPKGTYRISSTILLYDTGLQRHDGARIRGAGINETIFDFRGSGRVFDIRGIPASNGTGTQTGTYFIWGLELSGLTIDGANKTGTTDGFRLVGVWNSTFDNLTIKNLRYGIISDGDATYNPNPDWSSTSNCKITNCNFERLTEFGFFNAVAQAAPGWTFTHSFFVLCGQGGIRLASGGVRITECGFAGCGWSSEVATPKVNGAGLVISGSVTVATQICVENCEFDTNFTAHVDIEFAGGIRFSGNRYIFNDRYGYGAVCPTAGAVRIAAFGVGNAVQNVTFSNEFFRLDDGPTTGTPICFNFVNNVNVQNIRAIGVAYSDNNATLNLTKASGHTASNFWIRNNYELQLSDISDLGRTIPGRPFAEFIGTISGTPSTTGGNVLTTLKFDSQETVNNQIFGTSLYNAATGIFTCPVAGYYDIDFVVALASTISTDYNGFRIYQNGAFVMEWAGTGNGATRTWYTGRRRIFCSAADTLELREICSVSRTITGNYSYLRISLAK